MIFNILCLIAHPKWIEIPNDIVTITGHQIEVHCIASGSPLPRITWNKMSGNMLQNPYFSRNYQSI